MNEFKEFETENYKLKESGVLRKNGAGLIDALLVIIFLNVLFLFIPKLLRDLFESSNLQSFMLFYTFLIFLIYRFLTILTLGKTIGMAIFNIQFAKQNDMKLNFKEKLLSVIMIYINSVDCYNTEQ